MNDREYAVYRFARQNGVAHPPTGLEQAIGSVLTEKTMEDFKKRYDDEIRAAEPNAVTYALRLVNGPRLNGHQLRPLKGYSEEVMIGTIDELLTVHYEQDVPFVNGDILEVAKGPAIKGGNA